MPKTYVLLGPPGTGKTESGVVLARNWFKTTPPDRITYLAFAKAAAAEAVGRVLEAGISEEEARDRAPHFRTIHSLCYRGLRAARGHDIKVMSTMNMKKFSRESGLEGTFSVNKWEDMSDVLQKLQNQGRTMWDHALSAYVLSRITSRNADELRSAEHIISRGAAQIIPHKVDQSVYQVLVKKYEKFKEKEGLVDFTDMLSFAMLSMTPMYDIKYVILDEAQDLCPLHHGIVDRLFPNAEEIWWLGDDDQAIFRFSGASAKLFISRAKKASARIQLRQTYRFGQDIVDFSNRIIRRVKERYKKDVIGVSGAAGKTNRTGYFKPTAKEMLILHRHVMGCRAIGQMFFEEGVPFTNERGRSPLDNTERVKMWQALYQLSTGERAPWAYVRDLISDEMPSNSVVSEGPDGVPTKTRLVVHGAKAKLMDVRQQRVSLKDLAELKILTPDGLHTIEQRRYGTFRHTSDFEYYHRVVANGHRLSDPGPVITTIHASKGRQAPHVVVFNEMSWKCWNDRDTEHRLAYVAATRTEGSVSVCEQQNVGWAETRYDYPVTNY